MAVLGSLIIGIAYPIEKNDEKNDEVEDKEDLVQSLRTLIMGRFEDKHFEFFEWSRTMHKQVVKVIRDNFFLIVVIKAMKNIPMKVPTKTLAFTDPTAVANDRITGETSVIAFRATALKNGFTNNQPGI